MTKGVLSFRIPVGFSIPLFLDLATTQVF
jgi:hypothetical protein